MVGLFVEKGSVYLLVKKEGHGWETSYMSRQGSLHTIWVTKLVAGGN